MSVKPVLGSLASAALISALASLIAGSRCARDGLGLIRLIPYLDSDRHRLAITHHLNFNAFTERR